MIASVQFVRDTSIHICWITTPPYESWKENSPWQSL